MVSAATWRLSTASGLLVFTGLGLIAGGALPVLAFGDANMPLWELFALHPTLGIVGIVILITFVMLMIANTIRALNLNLNGIVIRNTPLTPLVSLLGLGTPDVDAETTRLNLVLTGLLLGAILLLGALPQVLDTRMVAVDGYGVLLFFVAVPLAAIALACHPRLSEGLVARTPMLNSRLYFEVRRGRLIGAKLQIDLPPLKAAPTAATTALTYGQAGLFCIGRGEMNDMVLFDESPYEVLDTHACLYFPDLTPTLRIYGPVRINDELYERPDDYPLEHQFKFQIGQTVIRFLREPLS